MMRADQQRVAPPPLRRPARDALRRDVLGLGRDDAGGPTIHSDR
jgi:hypothetical protein